jgi:hypothetical protein
LLCYFGDRVSLFAQADLDCNSILCFLPSLRWQAHTPPHPALLHWDGGLTNCFYPCWPGTVILPISAFHVAWVTGVYYHIQLFSTKMRSPELFCLDLWSSWSQHLKQLRL